MATQAVVEIVFAALQGIQVTVSLFLGFPALHGHRKLIVTISTIQALRHLQASGAERTARSQLLGFALGSVTLFMMVETVAARISPTVTIPSTSNERTSTSCVSPANVHGPWLMPCKTTHTRQFPKKHGFAYSYLQVAFQVGPTGVHGASLLGIESEPQFSDASTWFSISAVDYLFRGPSADGTLLGKLRDYLQTENVDIEEVPYVFLVSAPRFLGYSFNPVSFWYLYDRQKKLRYMLLEVNNTFDERRLYLLDRHDADTVADEDGQNPIFRRTWPKDFHVSPFNSRKGSYSLLTHDPGFMSADISKQTCPQIDNTITLRSSKSHAKLVARLFSTGPALSANSLTFVEKMAFIVSWCWVGFFTFPRILKEAAKLFFARGLHVWFRPEVLRSSIGRQATWREEIIGEYFGEFLQQLYQPSNGRPSSLDPISYTHSLAVQGPRTLSLGRTSKDSASFQILTPVFYAQYAVDMHILDRVLAPEAQLATIHEATQTSPLGKDPSAANVTTSRSQIIEAIAKGLIQTPVKSGYIGSPLRWRILGLLRRWIERRDKQRNAKPSKKLANVLSHPLDDFVFSTCVEATDSEALRKGEEYRKAVTCLLFAECFTFGSPELLDAGIWVYEVSVMCLALMLVVRALAEQEVSIVSATAGIALAAGLMFR